MLALAESEARTCDGCGSDLMVSMNPGSFETQRLWVEDQAVCHVCEGKDAHKRHLQEKHKSNPSFWDGRVIHAYLRDREGGDDGSTP